MFLKKYKGGLTWNFFEIKLVQVRFLQTNRPAEGRAVRLQTEQYA